MKYRVATVTNNLEKYPEYNQDTMEFSFLAEYVEDEVETFVISEDGEFWQADEFFYQVNLTEFNT